MAGTSMKTAKRRLGIGRNQMYAIKKPDGEVRYNKNAIIRIVEDFYRDLYNSNEQPRIEANAPGYQAGFRSGFSTTDHIHTFTQIRENINEYREPLCMAFIDYEKAFDSVQIPAVLEDVRRRVVEKVYCKILQDIYRGEAATIKIHMEAYKILI
ncbi:uncharacterized protein [Penaeus vannamei]|uniref:uncharacterized protein n=1 Tax=Penaeus vannamei TaxID=6689 RepID=UPI00387F5CCC